MDFRTVLTGLNGYRTRGINNFDSIEAANLFSISKAQGSKYLSRLHQMGFLKRTRHKRICLSKSGKLCNKGYFYTYEFSKQGEQYLRWMYTDRPVQVVRYYKLVEELSLYLPKQVKDKIFAVAMTRTQSRYKGSNQSLQTIGNIIHGFPSISKSIMDMIRYKDILEIKNNSLNSQNKELESKLKKLEKINNDLNDEIEAFKKETETLSIKLAQNRMLENEMDFHINAAHAIINTINSKMIKELSKILLLRDFDNGSKIIEGVSKRYNNDRNVANEHIDKAKAALKEIQTLTH